MIRIKCVQPGSIFSNLFQFSERPKTGRKPEEKRKKAKNAEAHLHFIFCSYLFLIQTSLTMEYDGIVIKTLYASGTGRALRRVMAYTTTLAQAASTGDWREERHFYTSKQVEIFFNSIGWPPAKGAAKWREVA